MCDQCGYPGDSHYTLGVVYRADQVDGHGDFMKANTLRDMAWGYIAKGAKVGLQHLNNTLGHGRVVESYLYQGPDWHIPSPTGGPEQVIKAGDYCLGVVWDAAVWPLIKSGRFKGWSIQGTGTRRRIRKELP